jgi:hypothetical protein
MSKLLDHLKRKDPSPVLQVKGGDATGGAGVALAESNRKFYYFLIRGRA